MIKNCTAESRGTNEGEDKMEGSRTDGGSSAVLQVMARCIQDLLTGIQM